MAVLCRAGQAACLDRWQAAVLCCDGWQQGAAHLVVAQQPAAWFRSEQKHHLVLPVAVAVQASSGATCCSRLESYLAEAL